ncbi:hypothetical protein DCC81_03580 [Chitinophaga parva]|uniref:Uncharacterized protein n=1 Tax=Chitinophaga parva TaxID=2169414 RepID=A0A2T7BLL5_9BACT|nr:hypothetical protein [Chitinophaga parva]PUZ28574.1 hypothetical protein DCC81_03580 [Chitinophaga parva]
MEKEFFSENNWPYTLKVSGSFVHSPNESLNNDRFLELRHYRHFSAAFTDMLSLSTEMFEQELLPDGPKSTLYNEVDIIHTPTQKELVSYLSLPLSGYIRTGQFAGLYLVFADPAEQMAAKYKLPLDRLSHYDPGAILQLVADYDTNNKNIIRVDPNLDQVVTSLSTSLRQEGKDTHRVDASFQNHDGKLLTRISHHFDGLAAGMDALLHFPLYNLLPSHVSPVVMTSEGVTLRTPEADIASIGFQHMKGQAPQPAAGFHLSFAGDAAALQQSLGLNLSSLPKFEQHGKDHYLVAIAEGDRPAEVAAFTVARLRFHDQVIAARKAARQAGSQPKTIFPRPGKPLSH